MKKKLSFLFLLFVLFSFSILNVNASGLPYNYIINGKEVFDTNEDGTASISKTSDTVTLTLNNYNGGLIKLNCYGTAQDGVTFYVKLIGENKITADDIGIDFPYNSLESNKLKFVGEGTLEIIAKQPISYTSVYQNKLFISPSKAIFTSDYDSDNNSGEITVDVKKEGSENVTSGDTEVVDSDKNKSEEDNGNDSGVIKISKDKIILYSFVSYVILSLFVITFLVVKIRKLENN